MATGPQFAKTPLELLTNDGSKQPSIFHKTWAPAVGAILGLGGSLIALWATKRPLTSGIHKTAAFTVFGGAACSYLDEKRKEYYAERDAILRHYVELHPDDFPPFKTVKFADVLLPWVPVR